MLKQSIRNLPAPLRELITVAHEAHFRSKIWLALKHKRYRHQVTITWAHERRAIWLKFCQLVKEDRNNNDELASKTRLEELEGDDVESGDESSDGDNIPDAMDSSFY